MVWVRVSVRVRVGIDSKTKSGWSCPRLSLGLGVPQRRSKGGLPLLELGLGVQTIPNLLELGVGLGVGVGSLLPPRRSQGELALPKLIQIYRLKVREG